MREGEREKASEKGRDGRRNTRIKRKREREREGQRYRDGRSNTRIGGEK